MIILQFIANGLSQGAVYGLTALGFALVYRITKVFNIAQGVTYTLSAYVFYWLARMLNLPTLVGLLLGILCGVVFVIISELVIFYPLYKKESSSGVSLIASLGVYIFIVNLIALLFGNEIKVLSPGVEQTLSFTGIILTRIQLLEIIVFIVFATAFLIYLGYSKIGRNIRGLIDNAKLCSTLGMNIKAIRLVGCAFGGFLISTASSLVALDVGIDPQIGINAILNGAVGMIIGGITSLPGAAIGGLLLGIIQNLVVYQASARWQNAITFGLLIIFLIFKPEGIFGSKKRAEEG